MRCTHIRIQLFQPARGSHECSAGAQHGDKVRDTSFGLLPDFVGRAMVVSLPVGIVGILVCVEIKIGMLGIKFARHADGAVGAFAGIGVENIRAVSVQNALAFRRNILRHAQRDGNALGGADHRVSDAGVAAGRIEQNFARRQFPAPLRFQNDARGGAIFHRSARVVPLGFA